MSLLPLRRAVASVVASAAIVVSTAGASLAQAPSPSPSAPPYDTVFYTHDRLRLEAYVYRPGGPGPFPLVVYNHGSRPNEERTEWPVAFIGRLMTGAGYAVLVPERRGYGRSEGTTFTDEIGDDRGPRYVERLRVETGDVLAALDHVLGDPTFRIDRARVAVMGWSFGGIVTTFAAGRAPERFVAAVVQAPGALTWPRSPALREALPAAARGIKSPLLCQVAENDATVESTRAVCREAHAAPGGLRIYPPFTPSPPRADGAQGHALFSPQGVSIWKDDVLGFLARVLAPPSS